MPLSANTLIHFTKHKNSLKSILSNNFQIFYCYETIVLNSKTNSFYVPMVSFCDIPLSEVKEHISKYGNYGIGMTKEWGEKQGLNPVLYISQHSTLSKSIGQSITHFAQGIKSGVKEEQDKAKLLLDTLRYIKNYEGRLKRKKGKIIDNYRFSDEREWRYVPDINENISMIMGQSRDAASLEENKNKLKSFRLEFSPNDIKYIIIKNESEISDFVAHLKNAKGKHFTADDIERLTTRIITADQIKTDM